MLHAFILFRFYRSSVTASLDRNDFHLLADTKLVKNLFCSLMALFFIRFSLQQLSRLSADFVKQMVFGPTFFQIFRNNFEQESTYSTLFVTATN